MEAEKIPNLTCKECGSFRVMMTNDGPECEDCIKCNPSHNFNLSMEVEYLIYQLGLRDGE